MYSFDSRVRYSEVDHRGTLTLPGLINYFQDCSTFQSEDIGLGLHVLKERRRAWLLSYWQVVVDRFPALGEKITVGTFATGFKGLYGERNFLMKDGTGLQVACANSIWVFMDIQKGRPVRPSEEDILPYGLEPPLEMDYEGRKIKISGHGEGLSPFPVQKSHIDTNEHVNNCQYVQMALELLPGDTFVHQLRVEYKKSAVYGDMIYPRAALEKDRTVIELCDKEQKPYAVIELK
ncbi:acyl-[acyl-carrier-protein] thioesterase [Luxibacter massiliensis]|uniref:acyl-[acyl-carrier-protein] thioesterase n=1 Tax=Luxibacter massiliensis TaxID=2219695 RepID=UPI000F04896F|nr:acyl-ACP thioesterase domain-containing protein [Luxibacter massiliensis]